MGSDAYAILCYGVLVPEGTELPWAADELEGYGIDDWWAFTVHGDAWRAKMEAEGLENPYDEHGKYRPGFGPTSGSDPRIRAWHVARREHRTHDPLPVEEVITGGPDWDEGAPRIFAVPGTVHRTSWDRPKMLSPDMALELFPDTENWEQFLRTYLPALADEPRGWYLAARYW